MPDDRNDIGFFYYMPDDGNDIGFCTIGQLMKSMFTMKYSKKKIIQSLL